MVTSKITHRANDGLKSEHRLDDAVPTHVNSTNCKRMLILGNYTLSKLLEDISKKVIGSNIIGIKSCQNSKLS